MTRVLIVATALLAFAPQPAPAQPGGRRAWAPGESGFVVGAALGGGTALGSGTRYTPAGRLELELSGGYEFPYGVRPELAVALGASPGGYVGLRPGVHVSLADMPLYLRAAADWSSLRGPMLLRWLLAGGGYEIRLTGLLSGFAEVDVGLPLRRDVGLELLARAGISLRL